MVRATLPLNVEQGIYLDPLKARAFGEMLTSAYQHAKPYPHIMIDGFLPETLANEIIRNFPEETDAMRAKERATNYEGVQVHKRQVFPNDTNAFCRNLFGFFNSAPFLQFLEGMTGINGLIADPYFYGGGFHETFTGGKLGIHADFRIHEQLHLQRRMNLLIYLNKDWDESYGGTLEIWDQQMKTCHEKILPLFNRCVVFNTDDKSFHGHPEPLTCPPDRSRRSIALYYYTASPRAVYEEVRADTTMYRARPGDDALLQRKVRILRLQNYAKDWLPPIAFRALRRLKSCIYGALGRA